MATVAQEHGNHGTDCQPEERRNPKNEVGIVFCFFCFEPSTRFPRRLFHSCAAKTTNSSRGQPTPRMAVVSVWSLEEDTLKATFT